METHQQEIATPDVSRKVRSQKVRFGSTKWITYAAMFTALAMAMKLVGQALTLTDSFKITAIYAIWLVAAAVLGPWAAGTICALSDILGAIIYSRGSINPMITVACALYGIIAGLCMKLPTKTYTSRFIIAGVLAGVMASMLCDSFALWVYCKYILHLKSFMDRSFGAYVGIRALQSVVAFANIPIAVAMIPALKTLHVLPPIEQKTEQEDI